jgi:hypothetical protein
MTVAKDITMNNRLLSNVVGLMLIAGIGATGTAVFRPGALLPAASAATTQSQLPAMPAQPNADAVVGTYTGQATLKFTVGGVYSDALTLPTAPASDLGAIDLSLVLNQNGNAVSGYVNLDRTLVFSVEHIIQTATAADVKVGPLVQGSYDGANLTLESERVSLFAAGRSLMRQFRIIGAPKPGNANVLAGEYRETVWGYTPQPLTIVGAFEIARPGAPGSTPGGSTTIQTVADSAITKQGVAVTINVLANDTDANGNPLTITSVSKPQHGTAVVNGTQVTYAPNPAFAGVDTFSYFVSNGQGATAVGSVTVVVIGPVHLPLVRR